MPNYIHSDLGTSFLSRELKDYLSKRGIATSNTTPYHPVGNGKVERYNGIIWKAVCLALRSANLPDSRWEPVLANVLHILDRFSACQRMQLHMKDFSTFIIVHRMVCHCQSLQFQPFREPLPLQELYPHQMEYLQHETP